jgi:hypothetical protein
MPPPGRFFVDFLSLNQKTKGKHGGTAAPIVKFASKLPITSSVHIGSAPCMGAAALL